MENIDLALLKTAAEWVAQDGDAILATVAKTWGSSPRPAGSMMIWRRSGQFEGSLSGGCIEEELLDKYADFTGPKPVTVGFGITKEQAVARGLPCGGEVTVVVEVLSAAGGAKEILRRLATRERIQRSVDLDTGLATIEPASAGARTGIEGTRFCAVFEPKWRLLVIGAGQLSAYVTRFADTLGYEVCVCDPRENYRDSWLADDIKLSSEMPDDFVRKQACDAQTGVVALTHDPKLDDLAIMEALNSGAFYVGALGSSRTNGARRERLAEHFDMTPEQLAFMSGPIGIDLNTRTASEIALSIMTEITARRNGVIIASTRTKAKIDDRKTA